VDDREVAKLVRRPSYTEGVTEFHPFRSSMQEAFGLQIPETVEEA
jgi:hypothetical protein